ncbi:VCBS repeat-containing protein [Rhodophyticola sp. CCM32]|uniref:FG-GAP repeat domain-containing protein n=1 Tax=Rhodophyticola sp. CCM32 TaxID=2916397 RepID=UPI00107EEBDB|nr:VCBS repeat-containing protein [Rhodophyticola sp. CCM32]QBY01095.1 VCBS repeat-containing protein [Rhodophyticola sp. CCM32]
MFRAGLAGFALAVLPLAASACIIPAHSMTDMPETVVQHDGSGIYRAWFDGPTTHYTHGVLGDAVEATELWAESPGSANSCATLNIRLDADHVFEDLAPRLQDLDGDGAAEVIVVRTHVDRGAQLAIYGDAGNGADLRLLAATPYIGRTRRWLAPIGAADLDGDGRVEIAYIDRPHLARTLRVWRYDRGRLEQVAAISGLTNHRIGEAFISGGIRDCGAGPEIVTADADWTQVMVTRLDAEGGLNAHAVADFTRPAMGDVLACRR